MKHSVVPHLFNLLYFEETSSRLDESVVVVVVVVVVYDAAMKSFKMRDIRLFAVTECSTDDDE